MAESTPGYSTAQPSARSGAHAALGLATVALVGWSLNPMHRTRAERDELERLRSDPADTK